MNVYLTIGIKKTMSQPKFDTKINCLEQLKDEIGVILEVDPPLFFLRFFLFLMFTLISINLKKWIISHNDY